MERTNPPSQFAVGRSTGIALLIVVLYMVLVIWRYDSIPVSLATDTVQEVETGFRVIQSGEFKVMAFDPHFVGSETLWISISGLLISWFGHTSAAALASGWLAALLLLVSLVIFARQSRGRIDPLILVLTAISTLWLFHYARTGYRVTSSVFFTSLSLTAMLIFLRDSGRGWRGPLLLGLSMSIALYCYTSSRIVPIAYVLFAFGQLALAMRRSRDDLRKWFVAHLRTSAIAVLVSIPNILYALREPGKYFGRGIAHNLRGTPSDWLTYVTQSLISPLYYEQHQYGDVGTDRWLFDPVAVTLPVAGLSAVPLLVGIASLVGLILIIRGERGVLFGVTIFGLLCYVLTCTLIGFTGPSLTRLFINFPFVMIMAAFALTLLARRFRITKWICISLVILFVVGVVQYVKAMSDPQVTSLYAPAVREMIDETLSRSQRGQVVMVLLRRRTGVFRYYAHHPPSTMYAMDFAPPLVLEQYRIDNIIGHCDAVVVEKDEFFDPVLNQLRSNSEFVEKSGLNKMYFAFERAKSD